MPVCHSSFAFGFCRCAGREDQFPPFFPFYISRFFNQPALWLSQACLGPSILFFPPLFFFFCWLFCFGFLPFPVAKRFAVVVNIAAVGTCIWRFRFTVLQWQFSTANLVSYCPVLCPVEAVISFIKLAYCAFRNFKFNGEKWWGNFRKGGQSGGP